MFAGQGEPALTGLWIAAAHQLHGLLEHLRHSASLPRPGAPCADPAIAVAALDSHPIRTPRSARPGHRTPSRRG
jgi:hypothetical protein